MYLRIEFEVKTELVVKGLDEQRGPVEMFPRLQTQTQTPEIETNITQHS
jgi:hypothetical protein